MSPPANKSQSTTYQDCAFESVILRMKQSDLKANASRATYISYSNQLKGKNIGNITALLTEMLNNHMFPNTVILNQLIKRLAQLHQHQFSLDVHQIAVTRGLADAITYASTLDAIAKSAQPDTQLAVRLLEEAKKAGLADAITYVSTLDAIAKSTQPDAQLAVKLLEEAKKAGLANAITYARTLGALAKSVQPDAQLAVKLLEEAKKAGLADAITYASTLDALSKSAQPDTQLAVRLLEEAKKAGLADAITYKSTLDVLAKSAQPDAQLAEGLIDEAIKHFKLRDMRNGMILDLHGLSFGMVYFGLKRRVKQEMDANHFISRLTLIYGKGIHSSSREEIHPVKCAVWRVVSELSGQGISGQENKSNSGVFELSLRPVSSQPNASNSHRLFASKLNPNAKPFTLTPNQNLQRGDRQLGFKVN
ncbi:PPR repeat protein [Legionella sainthelensi]|uniref:PPR repeat protein n=1 Tax=Legionella sainthelensi TaxID=28087 RepID=A0A0W0YUH6_9GAMM|nr:hypothetical protein [Legionella sainthelensi]KTD60544.1 PPR repeat protein [Legionella sainthelensi]VEH31135.1 PPR repeat protein [Legionella sainthelensi]